MDNKTIHNTLTIDTDRCIGCSHCMRVCPTEALRVSGGKAMLYADWCIDCGECYKVCPTMAIKIVDDDFSKIQSYKKRIALVSTIFYAQFPTDLNRNIVNAILGDMGFTDICLVEQSTDSLADKINIYVEQMEEKPVISCFCPGVVRLIQVRFPSLLDRIVLILPPLEVTASYYKNKYLEAGVDLNDIGIFYVTPCIAKTAAIKSPIGGYVSPISGVLNMDMLYNKVMSAYKSKAFKGGNTVINNEVSSKGILWPTTGGEASLINGSALAVDGLNNVIDFLENLENDEFDRIVDYIELRICDESCAGGILTQNNRFVVADTLRKVSKKYSKEHKLVADYDRLCASNFHIDKIKPRALIKYDKDISKAIMKMEEANKLKNILPGIDCGACGAPSCEALAADIVKENAILSNCIFMRAIYEKEGSLGVNESLEIMEKVWGEDRFLNKSKNRDKH